MNHLEHHLDIGPVELFPLAREVVLTWGLQEGAGVIARPVRRVHLDQVVDLRLNPVWPISPRRSRGRDLTLRVGSCVVTEVIDEESRAGFVYRTLPGHLESGEQIFLVQRRPSGRLFASIVSDSVPGHPLLAAVTPLSVAAQRMMARRYAAGLRRALTAARPTSDSARRA
ncbi:DUF1990 family protein [Brevibacterium oceani]|uniref:DUF1990 family protein n=1 Tax=Brevibacterium oceani TaxID=358099 RepID=UPI0015E79448|nr:DUF1990 family protein [Brevibacterium oceani]